MRKLTEKEIPEICKTCKKLQHYKRKNYWICTDRFKTEIQTGKYPSNSRNGCYGYKSVEVVE